MMAFLPHFSWQRASFSGNNRYSCCSHADRWFIDSVRGSVALKSPRFHTCTLKRGDYSFILPRCHYLAAIMMAFLPHCRAGSNHDGISAALPRWQQWPEHLHCAPSPPHAAFVPLGLRGQCSAGGGALFADAQALAYPLLHLHLARSAVRNSSAAGPPV